MISPVLTILKQYKDKFSLILIKSNLIFYKTWNDPSVANLKNQCPLNNTQE